MFEIFGAPGPSHCSVSAVLAGLHCSLVPDVNKTMGCGASKSAAAANDPHAKDPAVTEEWDCKAEAIRIFKLVRCFHNMITCVPIKSLELLLDSVPLRVPCLLLCPGRSRF
jgi:hypothetical protein